MTDLSRILPDFPIGQYARLLPAIERQQLTTADLLTLEVADIGKRTQLSLLDVKRFCGAVLEALHVDLGVSDKQQQQQQKQQRPQPNKGDDNDEKSKLLPAATRYKSENNGEHNKNENKNPPSQLKHTLPELTAQWRTVSTLDETLDRALGGGIPTGRVTEITGESGAGKTQFLLTLLLAVQLPPSRGGLGRPALYISTEAPLSTVRLSQILRNHPRLRDLEEEEESKSTNNNNKSTSSPTEDEDENGEKKTFIKKPSLDHIASTVVPDLESQDHILSFQVPVEVARRGVGLLVLDSVAANYRVEFERTNGRKGAAGGGAGLAARSNELVRLGRLLHDLARQHDLAVVVSNQVADRFPSLSSTSSSSTAMATPAPPKSSLPTSNNHTTMMTVTQRNYHHHHHHHPAYMGGGGMKQSQESPLASRSRGRPSALTATTAMLNAEPTSSVPLPSSSADMLEDDEAAMAAAVAVRSSMPEPAPEPRSIFSASNNNHEHQQQYQHQQQQPSALLLDHQQRWFTGWGDEAYYRPEEAQALKTPSLGLVWSTQIATRIALVKKPVYGRSREVVFEDERVDEDEGAGSAIIGLKNWRRWMKVVFAPHVPPSSSSFSSSGSLTGRDSGDGGDGDGPVEFEITMGGLKAVEKKRKGKEKESR